MNRIAAVAVVVGLAAGASSGDIVLVDDFTDGGFGVTTLTSGLASQESAMVLGGRRLAMWTVKDNPLGTLVSIRAGLNGIDELDIRMGDKNVTSVSLQYGDASGRQLNLDAALASLDALEIDFGLVGLDTVVTVALLSGAGGVNAQAVVSKTILAGMMGTASFGFDELTADAGFDLSDLDMLVVTFNDTNSDASRQLLISSIAFVPSPGGAVLVLMGIAALGRRRQALRHHRG